MLVPALIGFFCQCSSSALPVLVESAETSWGSEGDIVRGVANGATIHPAGTAC